MELNRFPWLDPKKAGYLLSIFVLNTAVNTNLTMHAIFLFSLFKMQNLMHSSIKLLIPKIYFMYVWYINFIYFSGLS